MKAKKRITRFLLAACCMCAGIMAWTGDAYAAKISSISQAKQKALKKVPNAVVTDADKDYDDGVLVYEVELVKNSKKFDIKYRASDAKMTAYAWEKTAVSPSGNKALISRSKCKKLALAKVKNSKIISVAKKIDDGVDIYKVKLKAGNKHYTLKYHARTGALIDYEWELTAGSGSSGSNYISQSKAKNIALADVPGATVIKVQFDMDDGVPVYEVELVKGRYEYEYKIHAVTGKILEKDTDD